MNEEQEKLALHMPGLLSTYLTATESEDGRSTKENLCRLKVAIADLQRDIEEAGGDSQRLHISTHATITREAFKGIIDSFTTVMSWMTLQDIIDNTGVPQKQAEVIQQNQQYAERIRELLQNNTQIKIGGTDERIR